MDERRFLCLGDSYTIGEGVASSDRWTSQLAAMLRALGVSVAEPTVIARTGWTAGELLREVEAVGPEGPFDLVTVMVGVNDQYRGLPLKGYTSDLSALLDHSLRYASARTHRVLAISIPDWGVSPFAEGRDRGAIASSIDLFNRSLVRVAEDRAIPVVDVTEVSRTHATREDFSADGLHPSAQQHHRWAQTVLPAAQRALTFE